MVKLCPNCFSENISFVNTNKNYDLGYNYSCYDCNHDFDDPVEPGEEKDLFQTNLRDEERVS